MTRIREEDYKERNVCAAETETELQSVSIFSCAVLPGSDILSSHCTFTNSSGEVILVPSQGAFITVNSHLAVAPVKLSQGVINK